MTSEHTPLPAAPAPHFLDRIGIPSTLAWGFVGLLLFMVGDGVEAGYLAPFLESKGISGEKVALLFTVYGVFACVASWLSGALSDLWGPRRVMWIGLGIWFVFEVLFLLFGVQTNSYPVMLAAYALRGLGYPLFAFGFLVWIAAATPPQQLGSAAGWFWFAFSGGLPTLGSLFASFAIPAIGQLATFWSSLGLVTVGGLIAVLFTRDRRGAGRLAPPDTHPLQVVFGSVSITWREPKTTIAGIIRAINTSSEYAFLVVMPTFFVQKVGLTLQQWLQLLSIMFLSNILFNLVSGILADRLGSRTIVALGGGVGSAISIPLFYYVPLWHPHSFAWAALVGVIYGATIASFVPLSSLMPQVVPREKGAALSILGLGAGASVWLGPLVVTLFRSSVGLEGVIWIFVGMYLAAALMTMFVTVSPEARAYSESPEGRSDAAVAFGH
ncbi:MFS transporter [Rhizosaccharibacter radicis]|uniref:MFS transporter n=1 Tax=Rhizosaccharibacter radicis TaxID=2782605 RepID=A0ABT1VZJ3_9PROT|nr:MFS transporter [Acetobacteraceae bacterium KSS12]